MSFKSQLEQSKSSGRMRSGADIVISQTYKASTKSEELSVRISSEILLKIGMEIGSRVDVLHDEENGLWMVKKAGSDGFSVSGKAGGPTGLIRYTLKPGHHRLTDDRAELPVKREGDKSSFLLESGSVVFSLVQAMTN